MKQRGTYINNTFQRLEEEDRELSIKKISVARLFNKINIAIFDTGLLSKTNKSLFGVFIARPNHKIGEPLWNFTCFCSPGEKIDNVDYLEPFSSLPKRAEYVKNISELVYDTTLPLDIDSFLMNIQRGEKTNKLLDNIGKKICADTNDQNEIKLFLKSRMHTAISKTIERLLCDNKTAVPHYSFSAKCIQFLLPICLGDPLKVDCALVVQKDDKSYIAKSILSLDQAYRNARIMGQPHSDWLDPRIY